MVDNGMPPEYFVVYNDDIVTGDNNLPLRYTFDRQSGVEKLKNIRAEKIKKGEYKRAGYQKADAMFPRGEGVLTAMELASTANNWLAKRAIDLQSNLSAFNNPVPRQGYESFNKIEIPDGLEDLGF
jgi:hypothetical protein